MCVRALQAMKENSFLISGDLTLSNACSAPFLPQPQSVQGEEELAPAYQWPAQACAMPKL